jgi:hypothetical protein
MKDPTVSVVMSVYNDDLYVDTAIDSILEQTFEKFEFIIVNDGSTDDTQDIINSYTDDRIRIIENNSNIGLTRSLNRGLEHARGRYIARQDADDVSRIDRLERQVSYLDRNPSVAMVGSGVALVDESGIIRNRRITLTHPTLSNILQKNRFVHGSVLMRHDVLNEVGGYDNFFKTVQDYDLWLRIANRYSVRNIPAPLYQLRVHNGSIYISNLKKSLLYERYARARLQGGVSEADQNTVESEGIDAYREYLDDTTRASFYRAIATATLRYGNRIEAKQACRHAIQYNPSHPLAYVLFILATLGGPAVDSASTAMRAFLNVRNSIKNIHSRHR